MTTYTLTIHIIPPGTPEADSGSGPYDDTSGYGHVWYDIGDGTNEYSFGYAPDKLGSPRGPGKVYNDGDTRYDTSYPGSASYPIEISQSQYNEAYQYGLNPAANGFDPTTYNGLNHSCIDFVWGMLEKIGIPNPQIIPGSELKPTWNEPDIMEAIASFEGALKKFSAPDWYEPLVFDLGSGIQTTAVTAGTYFDNQNDGFAERTAWVGSNTGILVYDPSGGSITNGSQMFGTSTSLSGGGYAVDGFAALAALDSNSDGVINSSDADWSGLRIWVGGDGTPGSGTLETMSEAGVASIGLSTTNTNTTDTNGNYIGKTSTYSLVGGGTREVADVSFQTNPSVTIADSSVSLSGTISALPDLPGYGTVYGLQQAMQIQANSSDTTLEGYVESFVAATDDATRNTLVDDIIYQWTGVEGVSTTARGSYFNARQLEALEQFSGVNFVDPYNGTSDPGSQSVAALTAAYQQLHEEVFAGLETQADLASLFNDIQPALDPTTGAVYNDFSYAENEILFDLSANRAVGLAILADFNQALHAEGADSGEGFQNFQRDLVAQGTDVAATFLYGTPVVYGTAGDDVITAWAGDQTILAGQGGSDTLIGGIDFETVIGGMTLTSTNGDNETFFGGTAGDVFIGGVGNNEVFWGGANDYSIFGGVPGTTDTFIAGRGTETFHENASGSALVSYASGDGNLTISTYGSTSNKLILDPSISRSAVGLSESGSGFTLTDGVSGDLVTVVSRSYGLLEFADGTTINLQTSGGIQAATSGSTLSGTALNDIYSYNSGTGHTTLSDTGGINQIWMGAGISASNLSYATSGNDLLITDGVSGDQIDDVNRGVQTILFADGSTANLLAPGSSYTLAGGTTATGTALNDTYSFASGTGSVTISDAGGQNTLMYGSGITAGNLTYTGSGTDLLITDGVSGDQIDIQGQLGDKIIVQTEGFSGGSTIALSGLVLNEASGASVLNGTVAGGDTLIGSTGSQTLNGNGGNNDTFIIGAGNTTVIGGVANDTFSYASGDGNLTIAGTQGQSTIVMGSGISASSVSLTASGSNLLITDGVSGDQITIQNQLGPQLVVSSLVFADATTEGLEGVALTMPSGASVLNGSANGDTLTATSGTQTLVGNGGNDTFIGASGTESLLGNGYGGSNAFVIGTGTTTAWGGAGNDAYSYASGDGHLTIYEEGGQNSIVLASGLTASSLSLAASGSDLLITDGVSGDQITLKNQLSSVAEIQDIVFSDASTESLQGLALTVPSGSSQLNGTPGSDTLTGTSGTQTLTGNGGSDTFVIGAGTTTVIGGTGNDTYSYASGDGHLTIQDNAGTNTIVFASGIAAGDVSWAISGTSNLVLTDSVSGDQITINNQLSSQFGISSLVFSGGTTESLEGLNLTTPSGASTLNGTAGNDTLNATAGTEVLNGNGGNDTFITAAGNITANGGSGNDLFSYASGDGLFTINETGGNDTLQLGTGLTASNVSLSESSSGKDLIITDGVSGDKITIANDISLGAHEFGTIIYGDATTASLVNNVAIYASGSTSTLNGTNGNDTLIGGTGTMSLIGNANGNHNDVMVAGVGKTTAWGGTGNDIYSYASGDGTFSIKDTGGTDTLKLGSGLTTANVAMGMNWNAFTGNTDLIITDGTSGDQITISNFSLTVDQVETIVYGDGTTGSLINGLDETATAGNTTLWGTLANDTLIGGTGTMSLIGNYFNGGNDILVAGVGNTTAWGGTGNDIYSYASGDGVFSVIDSGGSDTLKLGSGLTAANVTMAVYWSVFTGYTDLIISDGVTGDKIDIHNITTGANQVETIVYGDGTTSSLVNGVVETATNGTTTLWGTASNDTLIGGVGTMSLIGNYAANNNDLMVAGVGTTTAWGGTGNDTYSYASGDGAFRIIDAGGTDTLKLASGLTSSNVSLAESSDGNDLLITDGVSGDQITISGGISTSADRVETLVYGDSSTLNLDLTTGLAIYAYSGSSTLNGTVGNDTLIGTSGNQTLNGEGGNDTFIGGTGTQKFFGNQGTNGNNVFTAAVGSTTASGGTGNDIYSYASGDGVFSVSDTGGTDTLKLASGLTTANLTMAMVWNSGTGNEDLVILDGTSGDTISLRNFSVTADQIETIVYGDGTTGSLVNNVNETATNGSTTLWGSSGNDTLIASAGTQTLLGEGGSDTFIGGTGTQSLVGNQGTNGNNVFTAAVGNTTAWGGTGNDTYSYASSDGIFSIIDTGGTDVLKFAAGITLSNISYGSSSDGSSLFIYDGTAGDKITVKNALSTSADAVETLQFNDGSTLNLSGLILIAATGNTTLNGTSGNDTLLGTNGNQTLNGNGGSDTFIGGTGTQKLFGNQGTNGNNVFTAAVGSTTASGGTGNDAYSYASGDGIFSVSDTGGTDTLKLASGLNAANLTMAMVWNSSTGNEDLIILDGTSGDTISLRNLSVTADQIETIVYGDGTTGSLVNGVTEKASNGTTTLWGTAGNDTLIGGTGTMSLIGNNTAGGNDVMVAGVGRTTAWGGTGNEIYSYASGDGIFSVSDTGGTDTLKLASGLNAANLTMAMVWNSGTGNEDLIISDGVTGDTISLRNFSVAADAIETIIYGDGTTASLVSGLTETATNGNTTLWGTSANDTLTGGTGTMSLIGNEVNGGNDVMIAGVGNTTAWGGTGNDIYSYASGDGVFSIRDTGGTDTLKLASGLNASSLTDAILYNGTSGLTDLVISDGVSGDKIEIYNITTTADQIETIVYGDGTSASLLTGLTETATNGTTTLWGTSGNDTLIGGTGTMSLIGNHTVGGNDLMVSGVGTTKAWGGTSGDTYSYAAGDGIFSIIESGGTDTLRLSSGLTSSNVSLSENSSGTDLYIFDGVSGDMIDIVNQISTTADQVETLVYGDGTTLNLTGGQTLYAYAPSGNTTLICMSGNNTLIATPHGSGTEILWGNVGNDVYSYAAGDGAVRTNDRATGNTDTLKLSSGLTSTNTWLGETSDGNDLLITDTTSGDQIDVFDYFASSSYKISKLVYGDGTSLNLASLTAASSTATTLNGTTGNDILIANTGNLTLAGKGGSDTYEFGTGMGHDYINNGVSTTNSAAGELYFSEGIADNQLWFDQVDGSGNISSTGNNLRITVMGSSTTMTVNNEFNSSTAYAQLSEFQLSNSGLKLDSQLSNLVSAMATFEANYFTAHGTNFDPTASGNSSITDTTVLAAVSSDWHS